MAFTKGNKCWELRSKHGRDALFTDPKTLWEEACKYFQWCEDNPLYETKAFAFQGDITTTELPLMRAMTIDQLQFFLGVSDGFWRNFKESKTAQEYDFVTVINDIERVIKNQKFQGAAANLLNPNIIARDLGLREQSELSGGLSIQTLEPAKFTIDYAAGSDASKTDTGS